MADTNETTVDHNTLMRQADDEFSIARAKAINTYAEFERSILLLFAALFGSDIKKSTIAFSHIAGTRRRVEAIGDLLQDSFDMEFEVFFKSISRLLSGIETSRNKIVHWIALHSNTGGNAPNLDTDIALHEHPDMSSNGKMYKHDIEYFSSKVEFYRLLLYYFSAHFRTPHGSPISAPGKRSWQDVFHDPVAYPPPTDHPLHRV